MHRWGNSADLHLEGRGETTRPVHEQLDLELFPSDTVW